MMTILAQVVPTAKTEENGVGNHPLSCVRFKQPDPIATDHKAAYNSWVKEHPSALRMFERMMKVAKGKRIVVFLDYDGTLSPIVNNPDLAFMSDEMRSAVRAVSKYFPTAIISGRSRDKVKEFVKLDDVYYAGSHGMDIMAPPKPPTSDGKQHLPVNRKGNEGSFQPAKKFLPAIQEIFTTLEENTRKIKGARVEDNKFCVSVHFRQVREEDHEVLKEKVKSVLESYPDFRLTWGRKVMEIRPCIEWNKGHAVEYLLENLGLSNSREVFPLYIGDDRTDEDAFEVIKSRGQGCPIVVSSVPKDTKAHYSLQDPEEVHLFLSHLARWGKTSSSFSRSSAQTEDLLMKTKLFVDVNDRRCRQMGTVLSFRGLHRSFVLSYFGSRIFSSAYSCGSMSC
ncbi:probable trehalose-phosphate phosphatase 4 isoform X2 [Syzygium oleosum]|uniref:probable trehalose-phosphate phosphatase 4 isoform X2 n=1 Tax=Syzygium oleosum TaxID=219896 RepID=UPI0024B8D5C0|nr:probable trehalose-phosphate phosphatase 4 isoform X2 [Syzygium oleosum]